MGKTSRFEVRRLKLCDGIREEQSGWGVFQYLSAPCKTFKSSHRVQAVVVEAEWKAWECPYTKNEDTIALRKFRKQIKVELGAKDGEIEEFLLTTWWMRWTWGTTDES
ncbi:hypothetical protein LAZ67_4001708 [Cordylochernes scorpioides]|uniref:Uncharacterized protein n=1 Tax=Cordylochernes scorpioides TaxID=51811 RepID=A0ABY6KC62_9ARAC|nr:hypothetical protein LAZ67_4001708 [Cordylochernes scorpioides]